MGQGIVKAFGSASASVAAVTAVSGSDIGPVYTDINGLLHTVISLVPVLNALPALVTLWLDVDDGNGWSNVGTLSCTTTGQALVLGQQNTATPGTPGSGSIWVPTNPAQDTWKVAAIIGNISGNVPPSGFVQSTFSVAVVGACLTTDCTSILFTENPTTLDIIDYVKDSIGTYAWAPHLLSWTQPVLAADPNYAYSVVTVQKGFSSTGVVTVAGGVNVTATAAIFSASQTGNVVHVAGVWNTITYVSPTQVTLSLTATNGSGLAFEMWNPAPDAEGANENAALAYYGRVFDLSGTADGFPEVAGSTVVLNATMGLLGAFPFPTNPDGTANPYTSFRVLNYAVSQIGLSSAGGPPAGTYTLQPGWPGGADHFDLSPTPQAAELDLSSAIAAPNVTSATCTTNYVQFGNNYYFNFSGTVVIPSNALALGSIVVAIVGLDATSVTLNAPAGGFGSSVSYQTPNYKIPLSPITYTIDFEALNAVGRATAGPVSVTAVVTPTAVSSVVISEVGPRQITVGSQTTVISVTPSLSNLNALEQFTFWFSRDGGTTLYLIGWKPFYPSTVSVDLAVSIVTSALSGGLTSNNWILYTVPGAWSSPGSPSAPISYAALSAAYPSAVTTSNAITLLPAASSASAASATVTNVSGSAPTVSNIYMGPNGIGNPWAQVNINLATPGGVSDPNALQYYIWCAWTDSSGTQISPGGVSNIPGWVLLAGQIWNTGGTTPVSDWINYPGPGIDGYLTYSIWALNQDAAGGAGSQMAPYTGNAGATLLACFPGAATYFRVHVGPPPASLTGPGVTNQTSTANPTGAATTTTQNSGTSLLPGWNFNHDGQGEAAPAGAGIASVGSQWAYTGTDTAIVVKNDGGSSTDGIENYVEITGPSSVVYTNATYMASYQALYFQVCARSNNPTLTGGQVHELNLVVTPYNNGVVMTAYVFSVSGYIPSWEQAAISGTVSFPANTTQVGIAIGPTASEPPGGVWDFTDVLVQAVQAQTVNGQTNTQVPTAGSLGGLSMMSAVATATTENSAYGLQQFNLEDASDGNIVGNVGGGVGEILLSNNSTGGVTLLTYAGLTDGGLNLQCTVGGVTTGFSFQVSTAGTVDIIIIGTPNIVINGHTAVSGATVTTSAGTKNIEGGFITS